MLVHQKQPKNEKWPATNTEMLLMHNVWFTDKLASQTKPNSWDERMQRKLIHSTRLYGRNENIYLFFTKPWLRVTFAQNLWHETAAQFVDERTNEVQITYISSNARSAFALCNSLQYIAHGDWQWSMRPCGCGACLARLPNVFLFEFFFLSIVANKLNHGFSFSGENFAIRMWETSEMALGGRRFFLLPSVQR